MFLRFTTRAGRYPSGPPSSPVVSVALLCPCRQHYSWLRCCARDLSQEGLVRPAQLRKFGVELDESRTHDTSALNLSRDTNDKNADLFVQRRRGYQFTGRLRPCRTSEACSVKNYDASVMTGSNSATSVPSVRWATTHVWFFASVDANRAGPIGRSSTVLVTAPLDVVTSTLTVPVVVSSGACTLIGFNPCNRSTLAVYGDRYVVEQDRKSDSADLY
jgi:hypothetical protein